MRTLFVTIVGVLLLVAGPILGYRAAMRQQMATRWRVLVWSTGGGAVAGDLFVGVLWIAGLLPHWPTRDLLRPVLTGVGSCALFGLVLGVAGLVPRAAGTPRLVVTGFVMAGLWALFPIAVRMAKHLGPEPGASGVVFAPDGAPAAGAALFLDRGSGRVERLTTDATGLFHTARGRIGAPQPLLLICVPGGVPYVARLVEYLLTPQTYQIPALPPGAFVTSGIRGLGWRQPIPPECLVGSGDVQPVAPGQMATREHGVAQQSGTARPVVAAHREFVGWPSELAPRASALSDAIQHRYGDRPYVIAFATRDTMDITFWEPSFWRDDLGPAFPRKSMPVVAKGSKDLAGYVLNGFGRDADVNAVRVRFIRLREERQLGTSRRVPAQEVSVLYTRGMLEPGSRDVQIRVEAAPALYAPVEVPRDSERVVQLPARDTMAQRSAALTGAILRAIGQRPADITLTGRDTLDVRFWNPSYWWKGDSLKSVPEASLPVVRQAAKRTAEEVWARYGRDAGINVIRVKFVRVRRDRVTSTMSELKEAQEVSAQFTRQQLESGQLDGVQLTIVQR